MTQQKKAPTESEDTPETNAGVGVVFLAVGLALVIPDGTRAAGLPFLILGIVFLGLGRRKPTTKRNK